MRALGHRTALIHSSYVGNKVATLVLQTLGYDVSAINTVHYSMIRGKAWKWQILAG